MIKRVFLFFLVNLLVMATVSIVLNILGVQPYLTQYGIDYQSLLIFCFVWGMGGSFISLLLSKPIAKWTAKVQIINPRKASGVEARLIQTVQELSRRARLPATPEVGIYQAPDINAFATGATKRNSLVAVSTGLLNSLDQNEVDGVLAHEVSHIANGDMVTMTLIQGVVNSFALFLSRIVSYAITSSMREEQAYFIRFAITIVLDIAFSALGFIVVAAFSRWREFRADAGGARLAGKNNMIAALSALSRSIGMVDKERTNLAALKISGKKRAALFSTHPPLEDRIQRLKAMRNQS